MSIGVVYAWQQWSIMFKNNYTKNNNIIADYAQVLKSLNLQSVQMSMATYIQDKKKFR